jgi:hypothetical protein
MTRPQLMSGGRYPVLRALGIMYLIGAAIGVLGGLFAAGWALISAPWGVGDRIALAMSVLAGSFFLVLTMCAIAEMLKLFIDLEHNTRLAAVNRLASTPGNGPSTDGGRMRMDEMDQETAESALLRGH